MELQERAGEAAAAAASPRADERRNSEGHNEQECDVCYENRRNTRLPCGHSNMCEACAQNTLNGAALCPVCRQGCTMAWCSPRFSDEPQFVDVAERDMRSFKKLERTAPLRGRAVATGQPSSGLSVCRQVACLYLLVFAVAVVLVFVGAVTTNWQCETRECSCGLVLPGDNPPSCARICHCLWKIPDSEETVSPDLWEEPKDPNNQINAGKCGIANMTLAQCAMLMTTPEYYYGECLADPVMQQPCGGPSTSFYAFTVGWYTIILLTNMLFLVCFCYCLGACCVRR